MDLSPLTENLESQSMEADETGAVPWTPRDVVWGIIAAAVILLLFVLVSSLIERWAAPLDPGLMVNIGTLVLLIPVWYLTIFRYGSRWSDLGLRPFSLKVIGVGLALFVLFFMINMVYAAILAVFGLEIQPDVIGPLFAEGEIPFLLVFGAVIVAPVVEEIFFRGFVFPGLRNKWGWKVALVGSAALFALVHIIPTSYLPIFLLGAIFAYLYQISGSIWPGILLHTTVNSLAVIVTYAVSQGWVPAP